MIMWEEWPCQRGDCDWRYDPGEWDVGINPGWVCEACGAIDVDRSPPDDDWPEEREWEE
jgi:hypothetical protein